MGLSENLVSQNQLIHIFSHSHNTYYIYNIYIYTYIYHIYIYTSYTHLPIFMVTPHVPPGKALTRDGAADVLEAHLISQIDWNKF